ncbi:MAG: ORF6N domain-containing protein [Nanoarchaeota archaeon]
MQDIKSKIHTIRGKQVMLDRDLAELYGVETRALKQAVKRNMKRFPEDFMFILGEKEVELMVSQTVIPSKMILGGSMPYAFTEQGVANLASVLNNDKAIEVNINIMRAFVEMRKFLLKNANVFQKFQQIDQKLLEHDKNFEKVFNLIQEKDIKPERGIFFDGQVFDAHKFVVELINSAKSSIVLIDNYIDTTVLTLMSYKRQGVEVKIYTKNITEKLKLAKQKFNKQYGKLEFVEFNKAHDRFLIVDDNVYHIGASLKDVGKKWFAFSRLRMNVLDHL